MSKFLILRLDGPMQAWGTHTFEDFRPSNLYPTRSGLLGLLGACLGIERSDLVGQTQLAASVEFTVRVTAKFHAPAWMARWPSLESNWRTSIPLWTPARWTVLPTSSQSCRAVNTCSTRLLQWLLAAGLMQQSVLTVSLTHYAARVTRRRWAAVPVR